jgi:hypothetical protein
VRGIKARYRSLRDRLAVGVRHGREERVAESPCEPPPTEFPEAANEHALHRSGQFHCRRNLPRHLVGVDAPLAQSLGGNVDGHLDRARDIRPHPRWLPHTRAPNHFFRVRVVAGVAGYELSLSKFPKQPRRTELFEFTLPPAPGFVETENRFAAGRARQQGAPRITHRARSATASNTAGESVLPRRRPGRTGLQKA